MERIGGIIFIKVNGEQYKAVGSFTYNLGLPKREVMVGASGIDGYKEMPQVPFVEGQIRDESALSVESLRKISNATVTLELANGKVIVIREAVEASDGNGTTEEGLLDVRFEGKSGEEVR